MAIAHTMVGTGPTRVIALHGWFGSAGGWGELPERVDRDAQSWAFLDYRGYGARLAEPGDYTLEEIAADALALADELGWDRYAIVGHSMGGAAMLRLWADAPERVTALIGISPVPASGVPFDEQSAALFGGAADDDGNRHTIIDVTTGGRHPAEWVDELVAHSVTHSRREAFGHYLDSWAGASFVDELPAAQVPVQVIAGAHDPALGPDTVRATWLQQLPGARLDVIEDAGHYAMYESPATLMESVDAALADAR